MSYLKVPEAFEVPEVSQVPQHENGSPRKKQLSQHVKSALLRRLHNAHMGISNERAYAVMHGEVQPETDQERELLALAPLAHGRYLF